MNRDKGNVLLLIPLVIVLLALSIFGLSKIKSTSKDSNSVVDNTVQIGGQLKNNPQYNWSKMDTGPYNDSISYAQSTNLFDWKDSGIILASHASVPDVIVKDGTIYLYFVDVSTDGISEQIGLLKSSDNGKTWSNKQILNIKGMGDKVAADPDPFLLPDGKIRLYFFNINEGRNQKQGPKATNKIYSAISNDGINFVLEDGIRFEYQSIFDPDVIKIGDSWKMYVGTGDDRVIYANSSDGLNFTYGGVALNRSVVPNIFYDGTKYYLFTAGVSIFTSNDGASFVNSGKGFHIPGKLTADPGIVKLGDGSYLLFYKTK